MDQPEIAADIFMSDPERNKIAVLSAIGKTVGEEDGPPKVTDVLINLEGAVDENDRRTASEARDFVIDRYRSRYSSVGERALKQICDDGFHLMQPEERHNGYRWIGEHLSARLFAALTGAAYVPSGLRFAGGTLQLQRTIEAIRETTIPYARMSRQVVTEGYFGFDLMSGNVVTLPRGGSDISGVVYAGALDGLEGQRWINENYTDRDGILSAAPDIVGADHFFFY